LPLDGVPDIRVAGLTKRYGDVVAVDSIDLDIAQGEFFTMLGPSGSGKTTTLRMIAGFEIPDEGSIELAGEDVSRLPPYDRPVNTVFQDYALFPHMTVQENVEYGLMVKKAKKGERRQRAGEALEMVRLAGYGGRKPSQLSGGQRQRVALARAIVNRPKVLLLDEPLGALDLKLRKQMQVETKKLQRRLGITFIFVTHDQEEALTMSNVIGVVNKGRIEQMGNSKDIYERPATRFVASFIGEANILGGKVEALQDPYAVVHQMSKDAPGISVLVPPDGLAAGQDVFVSVRPEKLRVGPDTDGCVNVYEGTVIDEVYIGLASRIQVQLDNGPRLIANVQISNIGDTVPIGTRLRVGWNPNNSIVVLR